MPAVEVWSERGRDLVVTLAEGQYTVGSEPDAVAILLDDSTVSSVHAILERVGKTWLVRDVGSRNGTFLAGERLIGQHRLRDGDEFRVGRTRLVFRDGATPRTGPTDALEPPPDNITPAERRVLVELCRPKLSHNEFQPPASVREIAARLFIGRNAVQFHLSNLYDKFGITGETVDRRVELANAAMRTGAVTRADLEAQRADDEDDRA